MYMYFFNLSYGSSYQSFSIEEKFLTDENIVEACEATEEDLLVVHTKGYLSRLKVTLYLLSTANLYYHCSEIVLPWHITFIGKISKISAVCNT